MMQFPGTNFHDLNLDWMLQQIKTMLAEWQEMQTDFTTLQGNFNQIQGNFNTIAAEWETEKTWMHNYVQTNLPTEVQEAFDAFIETPAFAQMITDDLSDELITSVIEGWLEDNITQETGYVLDTSLTLSNAAAPAKTVGDHLAICAENDADIYMEPWQLMAKKWFAATYSGSSPLSIYRNRIVYTPVSSSGIGFVINLVNSARVKSGTLSSFEPFVTELIPVSVFGNAIKMGFYSSQITETDGRYPRLAYKFCSISEETVTIVSQGLVPDTAASDTITESTITVPDGATHVWIGVYYSGYYPGTYNMVYKVDKG